MEGLGARIDGVPRQSGFDITAASEVMAILALDMKERGTLVQDTLVATVMSNLGLELALRSCGIEFRRAAVGDRNVTRLMEESGAAIGGETESPPSRSGRR